MNKPLNILLCRGYGTSKLDYEYLHQFLQGKGKVTFYSDLHQEHSRQEGFDLIVAHSYGTLAAYNFLHEQSGERRKNTKVLLVSPLLKLSQVRKLGLAIAPVHYVASKLLSGHAHHLFAHREPSPTNKQNNLTILDLPSQNTAAIVTTSDHLVKVPSQIEALRVFAIENYTQVSWGHNLLDFKAEIVQNKIIGLLKS